MADPVPAGESSSFAIAIDDSSPTVLYSPFADTFAAPNLSAGWNPFPTGPGGLFGASGSQSGQGTSVHATEADGASLSIRWNGTGISLYGGFMPQQTLSNAGNSAAFSVTLDGIPTTNYAFSPSPSDISNSVLASFSNLSYSEHVVVLTLHNPGLLDDGTVLLQFDRAVLTAEIPPSFMASGNSSANSSLIPNDQVVPDNAISFQGQWSFQPSLAGQNMSFHTSNNVGDRALFVFNGTAITLSGLVTQVSGSYNVSIDDETPITLSARSSLNASAPTVLFYRTGLDPRVMHYLTVVNAGPGSDGSAGSFLALSSVNLTTVEQGGVSSPPPVTHASSKLSRGSIAAIAVCSAVAGIAILVVFAMWVRRRNSERRRKQGFIQNPRLNRMRRFSFLSRSNRSQRSHPEDREKDLQESIQEVPRISDVGVLDITRKSADETTDEEMDARSDMSERVVRRDGRLASQNSDGSFSINLPKKPDRGYVRASTDSVTPTPRRDSISPIVFRASRPRGPRDMHSPTTPGHGREGSRGILLSDVDRLDEPSALPKIETISPLRVNFQDVPQSVSPIRQEEKHISTGATSIPQSLKIALFGHDGSSEPALPAAPLTPTTPTRDPHMSFLDMESSAGTSIKSSARSTRQSGTGSTGGTRDYVSADYAILPPDNRKSLALSMNIGRGPTSSQPSLSPSISLQPIPLPPLPSQRPGLAIPEDAVTSSDRAEPRGGPSGLIPSPTDSVPLTVSDIHFRHSSYSTFSQPSESRRASAAANRTSGSHRPPHPPLPIPQETKPFIVQKLLGMHSSPLSPPAPTPFSSPVLPAFGVPGPSSWRATSAHPPLPTPPAHAFLSSNRESSPRTK